MSYCKVCGKKLELTPEYDMCMECQGKQHQTFTLPSNNNTISNKTEMTPKEALKRLHFNKNSLEYCDMKTDEHIMDGAEIDYENILKALTELEELKRYPTSDEVCEALSERFDSDVIFDGEAFVLNHADNSIAYCYKSLGDTIKINYALPPSLITLIGRFYEGVEKVGKEE